MKTFDKWVTKKNVLITFVVILILTAAVTPRILWIPMFSLLIFSVITYPLDNRVFKAWMKFTLMYAVLYAIVIFSGNDFWQNLGTRIDSPGLNLLTVAFVSSCLYILCSLFIVTIKSIQVYRKK